MILQIWLTLIHSFNNRSFFTFDHLSSESNELNLGRLIIPSNILVEAQRDAPYIVKFGNFCRIFENKSFSFRIQVYYLSSNHLQQADIALIIIYKYFHSGRSSLTRASNDYYTSDSHEL